MEIVRYLVYILTLAMQITAALLLIGNVSTKTKTLIRETYKTSVVPYFENRKLKNTELIRVALATAYKNKTAFYLLMLGYLFSPLGNPIDEYRWYSVALLAVLSLVAFVLLTWLLDLKAKNKDFNDISKSDVDPLDGGPTIDD